MLAAGGVAYRAWQEGEGAAAATRTPRERAYAVEVATLAPETDTPIVTSRGRLESGRTLELHAALAGPLVELSDALRDGGATTEGAPLYRHDPAKLETALTLAGTDVAEADREAATLAAALLLSLAIAALYGCTGLVARRFRA